MPVYPGNPIPVFEEMRGETSTLTKVTIGTHSGTHVDAPSHVFKDGTIATYDLDVFFGPVRVIDATSCAVEIDKNFVERIKPQKGERLIFKTSNSDRWGGVFFDDFVALSGDAADILAQVGVSLVGIDALSIKKRGGKDYRAHDSLLAKRIPIIEGLMLKHVSGGVYTLSAFPIALKDLDGAPLRAILIQ